MATATKGKKNELSVYKGDQFLAIRDDDPEMREAMESIKELGETFGPEDLTRVPTPSGGATTWTIPGLAGDETAPEIEGALCYVQKRGVLWPSEEPQDDSQPVLVTYDMVRAEQVGPIPDEMAEVLEKHEITNGVYDWEKLPYTQFGSGKGGHGKRAKEQRVLFILREGDYYPLVVPAQPGSLKNMRQFILKLPQAAKVPYWRCVVGLKLEKAKSKGGQTFSRIVPSLKGKLSAEDGAIIKGRYTDMLKRIAAQVDVDEGGDPGDGSDDE